MAHRARLVFGGLVMGGSHGTLSWECMTLQAEHIHEVHAQETRIRGSVGRVTTGAALGLHRYVLINERALLVGVAFDTNRVSAGQGSHLADGGGAVDVMAVAALDKSFLDSMVIRLREVCLLCCMTSVAEVGLCSNEEMLRLFGVMRRVTVQAPNVTVRVHRRGEMPLLMLFSVAT